MCLIKLLWCWPISIKDARSHHLCGPSESSRRRDRLRSRACGSLTATRNHPKELPSPRPCGQSLQRHLFSQLHLSLPTVCQAPYWGQGKCRGPCLHGADSLALERLLNKSWQARVRLVGANSLEMRLVEDQRKCRYSALAEDRSKKSRSQDATVS